MNASELQCDQWYFCEWMQRRVKYCGTQEFQGKMYHDFWEPENRLYHWLKPEDVRPIAAQQQPAPQERSLTQKGGE